MGFGKGMTGGGRTTMGERTDKEIRTDVSQSARQFSHDSLHHATEGARSMAHKKEHEGRHEHLKEEHMRHEKHGKYHEGHGRKHHGRKHHRKEGKR